MPPGSTARSSSRSRGRASSRASTSPRVPRRSAGIADGSACPSEFPADQRVWLRFGAVDWRADVWVNGKKVGEHEGGYTPFAFDITDAVKRDSREHAGRPRLRPDRSQPADRQAGPLVHAQLGDLADGLARGAAEVPTSPTSGSLPPSIRPGSPSVSRPSASRQGREYHAPRRGPKHADGGDAIRAASKAVRGDQGSTPFELDARRPGAEALDARNRPTSTP